MTLPIVDNAACQQAYGTITNNMLCAGFQNGSKDVCSGDSGGPLMVHDALNNTWRQAGIVSSGMACNGNGYYGIYTRVKNYTNMIADIIARDPLTLISPSGMTTSTTPTFSWAAMPNTTSYQLFIYDVSADAIISGRTYTAARLGCEAAASVCNIRPASLVNNKRYMAIVKTISTSNSGTWGSWQTFTVASTATPLTFTDNPATGPYFSYVNAIAEANITTGVGGGLFGMNDLVTRGQMAAFVIRALDGEPSACTSADAIFTDVPVTHGFCKYIKRMKERNITSGIGNNEYGINQFVTREQMAAFIVRAVDGNPAGTPAPTCTSSGFGDVPTSNTYCGYIKRLAALGITNGCTVTTMAAPANYCPGATVTRGQMAAFVARAFLGKP